MKEREREDDFLWGSVDEQEEAAAERGRKNRRRKTPYCLRGSLAVKITVFFVLAISCMIGAMSGILCLYMGDRGAYIRELDSVLLDELKACSIGNLYEVKYNLSMGNVEAAAELCRDSNMDIDLIWVDNRNHENLLWGTEREYDTKLKYDSYYSFGDMKKTVSLNNHILKPDVLYLYRVYFNSEFPENDDFQKTALLTRKLYGLRYSLIGMVCAEVLLCAVCFVFLMCAAGRRKGREEIVPSVLTGLHLDVLTFIFAAVGACFFVLLLTAASRTEGFGIAVLLPAGCAVMAVWITLYCMEFALQMKQGEFWRHTLVSLAFKGLWKGGRLFCRGVLRLVRGIPLIMLTLTGYFGIFIVEFIWVGYFVRSRTGVRLWLLEKAVFLAAVMYIALVCRRLLKASRALAEGQEDYLVDTSGMFGDFREHGENLNSLGQGIAKAVAERIKSEHLKTELISNVSHDLKTPLTSIINYADLIYQEAAGAEDIVPAEGRSAEESSLAETEDGEGSRREENARIAEYAEVLLRQSRKLKKLLEDLMEASKATTGNLDVNPEPCEVGVLLTQAAGEYQQRMEEKELALIVRQPERTVQVMADGRHLWRVFDNLLNNICKYAQENSRVYLTLEEKEGWVLIIFRNMSKFTLDISAEDLEERFVRGDKSRHMEGNGLGLSIAKSLVELQNGRMEVVVVGELFKVTLRFPVIDASAVK